MKNSFSHAPQEASVFASHVAWDAQSVTLATLTAGVAKIENCFLWPIKSYQSKGITKMRQLLSMLQMLLLLFSCSVGITHVSHPSAEILQQKERGPFAARQAPT